MLVSPEGERQEFCGPVAEPVTTCNRAELVAIREGLARVPRGASVTVYSDSQLSVNLMNKRWKAKANRDLIETVRHEAGMRRTTFRWIRGHNGDPDNERADVLANQGRRMAEKLMSIAEHPTIGNAKAPSHLPTRDDPEALQRTLDRWHTEAAGL